MSHPDSADTRCRPIVFVVTGPSGSGKGTVLSRVVCPGMGLRLAVSATSRAPRPTDADGDYHFVTRGEFEATIAAGGFLEYAEFCGELYGTPRSEIERAADEGSDLVLEIEVQGARQIRRVCPRAVLVMLLPPTREECLRRLRGRGSETEERIQRRMAAYDREILAVGEFDYVVWNVEVDAAVCDLKSIIRAERLRTHRQLAAGQAAPRGEG
ncbi:MAG TPA: guanylate kinase [Armatimonadota bacterium]|nr:guanylate kinase [Armatimonadota bacterium]HQK93650.1 guanylate kinase [Armatimonadota bacterium]